MIKKALIALITFLLFTTSECPAEDDNKYGGVALAPYMTTIKEGDVDVVVPKGGQLQKNSSFLVMEGADEYSARQFSQMEKVFNDMSNEITRQKKELEELKKIIEDMRQQQSQEKETEE